MSKSLDIKVSEIKDLKRDELLAADRYGLDHHRRFKLWGQGPMSQTGCGNGTYCWSAVDLTTGLP
jgi:hypothetical protein